MEISADVFEMLEVEPRVRLVSREWSRCGLAAGTRAARRIGYKVAWDRVLKEELDCSWLGQVSGGWTTLGRRPGGFLRRCLQAGRVDVLDWLVGQFGKTGPTGLVAMIRRHQYMALDPHIGRVAAAWLRRVGVTAHDVRSAQLLFRALQIDNFNLATWLVGAYQLTIRDVCRDDCCRGTVQDHWLGPDRDPEWRLTHRHHVQFSLDPYKQRWIEETFALGTELDAVPHDMLRWRICHPVMPAPKVVEWIWLNLDRPAATRLLSCRPWNQELDLPKRVRDQRGSGVALLTDSDFWAWVRHLAGSLAQ